MVWLISAWTKFHNVNNRKGIPYKRNGKINRYGEYSSGSTLYNLDRTALKQGEYSSGKTI